MRQLPQKLLFSLFLLLIATAYLSAQNLPNYDYGKAWKQVQDHTNKSLPESALKVVNEIYEQAKKENNAGQLVKAVIHQLKFTDYKEENAFVKNLIKLRKEAENAQHPVKPLLHSMLAEMYWQYYVNNRYRFSNRSKTINFAIDDIETWSLEDIVEQTVKQYELSLETADRSKTTQINVYDEVLYGANEKGRNYRPTLYDFLAHRAFVFYAGEEPSLTKPAYQFVINRLEYLTPSDEFVKLEITSKDSLSFKLHALQILQDLVRFHQKDENMDALVTADLERLGFVYSNLTNPEKEEAYLKALQQLEQKTIKQPISTLVTYQIAQWWINKGRKYNPLQSDEYKWDIKKAFEICEEAKKRFPKSDGAINAKGLQTSIQYKGIEIKMEEDLTPQKPYLVYVRSKNVAKVYWRVIKTSRQEIQELRSKYYRNYDVNREEKLIEHFVAKTASQSGSFNFPLDGDYQYHATEVSLPALPKGEYMVIFSEDERFKYNANGIAYGFHTVSDISYVYRHDAKGNTELYVLNRQSGQPIQGVEAKVYSSDYNYRRSKYESKLIGSEKSNEEGYINIKYNNNSKERSFFIEFIKGDDFNSTLPMDGYYQSNNIYQYVKTEPYKRTQVHIFTDRSIYRPNQTVYFKALIIDTDGETSEIKKNYSATVYFYDVNHQVIAKQQLTTNEYGTFNGSFTTPSGGLMGRMYLKCVDNTQYIQVEEYKRPKFEAKFDDLKGSPRLKETVTVEGFAKAYSGANIDGAEVKYRVVRKARFPYWWYYWRGYYPSSPEIEIINGTTKTDENGKFKVDFQALPDESVDRTSDPTFIYTIYADVTDINGETHSAYTSVNIGYTALQVSVNVPQTLDQSNEQIQQKQYEISTTNLMGTFEATKGEIKVYKLKSPEKAYRKKLWQRPDKQIIDEATYRQLFPYDEYAEESNFSKWERESTVLTKNFDTNQEKKLLLENLKKWQQGIYVLEIIAKDKYGQEVKGNTFFTVFDSKAKRLPYALTMWNADLKTTVEPQEKAEVLFGSSEEVKVLYEVEHQGKIVEKQWLKLKNEQKILSLPIQEAYRGNVVMYFTYVKNNRLYQDTKVITVPYTNKELDITFQTFRNKLQPGEKEEWKLTVKGAKGDKVAAEMLATLYDASLDAFRYHGWALSLYKSYYATLQWRTTNDFGVENFRLHQNYWNPTMERAYNPTYDQLNWYGYSFYDYYYRYDYYGYAEDEGALYEVSSTANQVKKKEVSRSVTAPAEEKANVAEDVAEDSTTAVANGYEQTDKDDRKFKQTGGETDTDLSDVKVRTNFNETAFFYPELRTNENGEIVVTFTVPESLTRWKMLGLAHTQDLKYGKATNELVTQKDLMVVPNQPRFFRENDKMFFSVKISSLVDKELKGEAELQFFDALTMKAIDAQMGNKKNRKNFSLAPQQSTSLAWEIEIPEGVQAITYRMVAKAGQFSDGEEMMLPVLTNRMLVTETLPLPIRGNQTKNFTFEKLANNKSKTLRHQRFTLEFTSNPAWYAIQALPYLIEYPYECVEQTFSRFYANSIASHIANSNPKIKRVFDTWKNLQPDALLSNLEKNQELKTALLEETPWVLNAKSESERKRMVGVLFDLNRMSNEQERAIRKILEAQVSSGGFVWFKGFPEDRYMTQHIIAGMGHLDVLGVKSVKEDNRIWNMTKKAMGYLDREIKDDYDRLKALAKRGEIKLEDNHLGYIHIHYLYTRSYFKEDIELPSNVKEAFDYFKGQSQKYWTSQSIYMQGMIALALHRYKDTQTPQAIIKSLDERALHSEEMGMYWKSENGYWWYQAPIERQALLIEVYDEVTENTKAVEDLKVWLLKQKQTQDWGTTKATVEACYALLRRGTDLLASDQLVEVTVGKELVTPKTRPDIKVEAGTGYYKTAWTADQVKAEMGNIKVVKKDAGVAWGAVYWQYFEQLDKITPAETPLKLKKQLFIQKNTDKGLVITPITNENQLKIGDLVKVRIELRVDRDMEYVHLKDMRAAAFEPVSVISTYKYQDGLYYYESPRDMATNFFIGRLNKGTYVFEYALRVSQKGDFSNGITTIQCMYAPEFSSHSEGIRVEVK